MNTTSTSPSRNENTTSTLLNSLVATPSQSHDCPADLPSTGRRFFHGPLFLWTGRKMPVFLGPALPFPSLPFLSLDAKTRCKNIIANKILPPRHNPVAPLRAYQ